MISIIIPAYNRAHTIRRSIESVLDQTYQDIEIIVVDDCSTDNTKDIVLGMKNPRIRYDCLKKNSGACVARNRGIELAQGDFIAFQDSDDVWMPNKLQIQYNAMQRYFADICFSALRRHKVNDEKSCTIWPSSPTKSGIQNHVDLRRKSVVSTQTIIARRKVFDDVLFDTKVIKSQDYDWIIRASKLYRTYFVAKPLVEQYLQTDSISSASYDKFIVSREYLLNKYRDICEEDPKFRYYLVQQLAHYKTLSGIKANKEYRELFLITKNAHNLCSLILSYTGLIKYFVKDK